MLVQLIDAKSLISSRKLSRKQKVFQARHGRTSNPDGGEIFRCCDQQNLFHTGIVWTLVNLQQNHAATRSVVPFSNHTGILWTGPELWFRNIQERII